MNTPSTACWFFAGSLYLFCCQVVNNCPNKKIDYIWILVYSLIVKVFLQTKIGNSKLKVRLQKPLTPWLTQSPSSHWLGLFNEILYIFENNIKDSVSRGSICLGLKPLLAPCGGQCLYQYVLVSKNTFTVRL